MLQVNQENTQLNQDTLTLHQNHFKIQMKNRDQRARVENILILIRRVKIKIGKNKTKIRIITKKLEIILTKNIKKIKNDKTIKNKILITIITNIKRAIIPIIEINKIIIRKNSNTKTETTHGKTKKKNMTKKNNN